MLRAHNIAAPHNRSFLRWHDSCCEPFPWRCRQKRTFAIFSPNYPRLPPTGRLVDSDCPIGQNPGIFGWGGGMDRYTGRGISKIFFLDTLYTTTLCPDHGQSENRNPQGVRGENSGGNRTPRRGAPAELASARRGRGRWPRDMPTKAPSGPQGRPLRALASRVASALTGAPGAPYPTTAPARAHART